MQTIQMVITNNGDDSNGLLIVKDELVMSKMQELADEGDERFASGDGLQYWEISFPEGFDVDAWVKLNFHGYTSILSIK